MQALELRSFLFYMKEEIGYVYMITSPIGRLYIGSTLNFLKRENRYKGYYCKKQTKLYNSLVKYKYENHKFEIIWEGNVSEMYKYETLIGWGFDVLEKENLNLKLPKLGDIYSVVSDETKKKIGNSRRGKKQTQEARDKVSKSKKGKKLTLSHINNHAKAISKAIVQYDKDNNFIKEWQNAIIAGKELKINAGNITTCCKNKRKTA